MHILIIGAAGMVGRKLTQRLVKDGTLGANSVEKLTLVDVVAPERPQGFAGTVVAREGDLSASGEAEKLRRGAPGCHLPSGGNRLR